MLKKLIFFTILALVFTIGIFAVLAVNNRGAAPVAYWKFDEGADNTCPGGVNDACDSAGANDGTITNALWRNEPDCKTGKCLYFDGDGDYVSISDSTGLRLSSVMTISAWVKPNTVAAGYRAIIDKKYNATTKFNYYFGRSGNKLYFEFTTNGTDNRAVTSVSTTLSAAEWAHVAVVYNDTADTVIFYKNGIAESLSQTYSMAASTSGGLYIGENIITNNESWSGLIDDVRIYNYARTAAQIKADYLSGASRGSSVGIRSKSAQINQSEGLIGHWKMDESSWTVDCSTDTVMDSSGNGKHGDACPNAGGLAPAAGKYGNAGVFDGTEDYVAIPDIDF